MWMYVWYPVTLMLISKIKKVRIIKEPINPKVSVLVCTHNEASVIDRRIRNILEQNYPREKMEIIVVDSSTDATTDKIKGKWRNDVLLIEEEKRRGKASAINLGLEKASGDIIILSDAPTLFYKDTVKNIVKNFADSRVGGVTGKYEPVGGEKLFWKFKNRLRYLEGQVDSTTWLSGELCAFRKSLIEKVDEDSVADDVNVAMKIRKNRYKAIYDASAQFTEKVPATYRDFLIQKTRRAIGGIQETVRFKGMIFNPRFGLFGMLIMPTRFLFTVLNPFIFLSSLVVLTYLLVQINLYLILSFFVLFAFTILSRGGVLGKALLTFLMTEIVQLKSLTIYIFRDFSATWEQAETTRRIT